MSVKSYSAVVCSGVGVSVINVSVGVGVDVGDGTGGVDVVHPVAITARNTSIQAVICFDLRTILPSTKFLGILKLNYIGLR